MPRICECQATSHVLSRRVLRARQLRFALSIDRPRYCRPTNLSAWRSFQFVEVSLLTMYSLLSVDFTLEILSHPTRPSWWVPSWKTATSDWTSYYRLTVKSNKHSSVWIMHRNETRILIGRSPSITSFAKVRRNIMIEGLRLRCTNFPSKCATSASERLRKWKLDIDDLRSSSARLEVGQTHRTINKI